MTGADDTRAYPDGVGCATVRLQIEGTMIGWEALKDGTPVRAVCVLWRRRRRTTQKINNPPMIMIIIPATTPPTVAPICTPEEEEAVVVDVESG